MEDAIECPICGERFDDQQRRPKMLHCGHTFCSHCIGSVASGNGIECPIDREATLLEPHQLRDNIYLMSLLDRDPDSQGPSTRDRYQQSLEMLIGQQRDRLDALGALSGEVEDRVRSSVQDSREQLQRAQHWLGRVASHRQDQEAWGRIRASADKVLLSCGGSALEQELQLLAQGQQLRVSVRVGAPQCEHGWRGDDIALHDSPELRLTLLLLLRQGKLHPSDREPGKPDWFPDKLDLAYVTREEEKETLLQLTKPVRVLINVWCNNDPAWKLSILEKLAPNLEELRLFDVEREHVRAVLSMPRLRRLEIWNYSPAMAREPLAFRGQGARLGLQWLELWLPSQTAESLLFASRHTLREMRLSVPVPGARGVGPEDTWPLDCRELAAMLERCELRQLRNLTLLRFVYPCDGQPACAAQLDSVRRVLPDTCQVECEECSTSR